MNEGYDVLINAMAVCIIGGLASPQSRRGIVSHRVRADVHRRFSGPHRKMIVSLVAILVILVVKPRGLFGKQKELEERI